MNLRLIDLPVVHLQRKIIRHLLSFFPANFTLEPSYFFCGEVFSCLISVVHIGHTDSLIASQPSHAFVSAISAVLTVDSYPVFTCLKGPSLMLFIHCMWVWLDIFICSCPPPPMMNEIGQIFQDQISCHSSMSSLNFIQAGKEADSFKIKSVHNKS